MGTRLTYRKSIKPKNAKRKISRGTTYRIDEKGNITKYTYRKMTNVGNSKGNK